MVWKVPNKYIAVVVILITVLELILVAAERLDYLPTKTTRVSAQATGIVSVSIVRPCQISLVQGWNLISICTNLTNKSITSILSGTNYQFVLNWNESLQGFDVYSSAGASNPFNELQENKSYFVYISSGSPTLSPVGSDFGDLRINLVAGWNAPTYPYDFSANVSKYIDPIQSLLFVLKWNSTSQAYMIFSKQAVSNPFSRIYGGEGQLLHVTSPENLSYNRSQLHSS